jgi:hypothetical protein
MALQWYTLPALGYLAFNSAIAQAVRVVNTPQISQPYRMTLGPPVPIALPHPVHMEGSTPTAVRVKAKDIKADIPRLNSCLYPNSFNSLPSGCKGNEDSSLLLLLLLILLASGSGMLVVATFPSSPPPRRDNQVERGFREVITSLREEFHKASIQFRD